MPRHNYVIEGAWNAQCDICSRIFKSDEMRKTWDNYMTCPQCWYPRNPQDFIKGIPEHQNLPWNRPYAYLFDEPLAFVMGGGLYGGPGTAQITTPSAAGNTPVGYLRTEFELALADWASPGYNAAIITKGNATDGTLAYTLGLQVNGQLSLLISQTGNLGTWAFYSASALLPTVLTNKQFVMFSITWLGDNGIGNSACLFQYSTDNGATWHSLGVPQLGIVLTAFASTAEVRIGPILGSLRNLKTYLAIGSTVTMQCIGDEAGLFIIPGLYDSMSYTWTAGTGEVWTAVNPIETIPQVSL